MLKISPFKIVLSFLFVLAVSCQTKSQIENPVLKKNNDSLEVKAVECKQFERNDIVNKLKNKISESKPLYVHIFVPLCDDIHQGIVPTNSLLGDGMNLRTNLYWGAGYGIKTHFKKLKDWMLIKDTFDIDSNILERVVFVKTFSNKTKVYIVADAYRGDRMAACVHDYLNSLAGINKNYIIANNDTIATNGNADFLIFNGHNGLMDDYHEIRGSVDNIERDAAVIACVSKEYFIEHFICTKSYPLVTTTSLLPPEAYVAAGVINSWALMKSDEEIRISAGDAMARIHKKSQTAMRRMFATGW